MMSNQRQPPNMLLVAEELRQTLVNRDDDDEEDIDLTHFRKAMAEIIKVFPLLDINQTGTLKVFEPIRKDIANANDELRAFIGGTQSEKYKCCLSMIQYETEINTIHDEESKSATAIVNTLNRILKFLVLLIEELSNSEPVTPMAPIVRRLYDQLLASRHKWSERQIARDYITTLPKQAQMMKLFTGGSYVSPTFEHAVTQLVMYGKRVCDRIEKIMTTWNVQNVTM